MADLFHVDEESEAGRPTEGVRGSSSGPPEVHPKSWTVNNVFICNEFDTVSDSFRLTVI